jgi:hypothetical protein
MTQPITVAQKAAVVEIVFAIRDAIKELGEVPSGHLYGLAAAPAGMSLENYQQIIDLLKQTGKVTESNHLLKWVG